MKTRTLCFAVAVAVCMIAAPSQAETPDYFVEWVQPSANLYVDTGITGKCGVKAEISYLHVAADNAYPVMLGAWGGNRKRFNLAMHNNEVCRWEYGDKMVNGLLLRWGGAAIETVECSVSGVMTATRTNTKNGTETPTMDATATYGVLGSDMPSLYLFASHYKDSSSDKASQPSRDRLYYCRLYEGDTGNWTLVRNLRPCVKDGVAGLYDSVRDEILYPVGNTLVAGSVAYDKIAAWNGGATPTAEDLATASNWTCTDPHGVAIASAVPDKATLAVFADGPGSVTLPSGYVPTWGAVGAGNGMVHPATQYGTCGNNRSYIIYTPNQYTLLGAGSLGDLVKVNGAASKANFQGKQMRHDGWFYVDAAQAGTWTMTLYVDDYYAFAIDGRQVLFYDTWQGGVVGQQCEVSEGWHRFTSVIGDTGGGWGTATAFGNDKVPFTFTANGTQYTLTDDAIFPKGSGDGKITLAANADWSQFGAIALAGGAVIDLNGHQLTVKDIAADDYLGSAVTNSASKKAFLRFTGVPMESKAVADGIIKEVGSKIILAEAGDLSAIWTGAAGDGNALNANNWQDTLTEEAVVPTANHALTVAGDAVNLQIPFGSTFACKSLDIGNCTFTADCDWRGLSVKPTISGTADLAGHNLQLNDLAPGVGSSFANSSATASQVRLPVAIVNGAVTDEGLDNLSVASNVQIVMANSVNTTATANSQIGYVSGGTSSYVQTGGTFTSSGLALELGKKSGGTGLFRIEAGTAKISTINAQSVAGANARIEITNGQLQASAFYLGNSSSGSAIVNQTGGTFTGSRVKTGDTSNGDFRIGHDNGGTGVYNLTGGKLTTKGTGGGGLLIGYASGATGRMTVGGAGVVDINDGVVGRQGTGYLTITNGGTVTARQAFTVGGNANKGNGVGTVKLTGGKLDALGGNATYREILVGRYRTGTLDIGGDGVVNASRGVMLGRETTGNGTLKLSGNGVLNTSKIVKGGGKAAAEFAGGKVVLTNVGAGSEALLLSGFDSLKIGDGGLAVDTAGHDASLEIPENFSRTDYASALVKDGAGTLTLNKLPDVASVTVNAGTLVVTNGSDNTVATAAANTLAHRWSFNDGFEDSVGNVTATRAGAMPVTLDNGQAVMQGGTAYSDVWGGLNLGTGVLGTGDATIEIWGTLATPPPGTQWAYLAAYGNDADAIFAWAWQAGNNWYDNAEIWYDGKKKAGANGIVYRDEAGLRRETKKEYHLAVTFTDNGDGTTNVRFSRRDTSTNPMTVVTYNFSNVAWSIAEGIESWALTIGHNPFGNRMYESNAKYNEVRVWHSALSDEALKASALYGPDATADQIAVLSDPASVRALNVASGAEVSLGGNTLTQPVVSGGGTISGGSLNVTKVLSPGGDGTAGTLTISGGAVTGEIRLDVGDKIVVDGGTLDLTGATVTLLDPENLVEAFTFVECVNGGSLAGKPAADETIQSPWKVLVSGSRVRITKAGTAIFLR